MIIWILFDEFITKTVKLRLIINLKPNLVCWLIDMNKVECSVSWLKSIIENKKYIIIILTSTIE